MLCFCALLIAEKWTNFWLHFELKLEKKRKMRVRIEWEKIIGFKCLLMWFWVLFLEFWKVSLVVVEGCCCFVFVVAVVVGYCWEWLLKVSGIYEKGGIFFGPLALFFFGFSGFTFGVVGFVSLRVWRWCGCFGALRR